MKKFTRSFRVMFCAGLLCVFSLSGDLSQAVGSNESDRAALFPLMSEYVDLTFAKLASLSGDAAEQNQVTSQLATNTTAIAAGLNGLDDSNQTALGNWWTQRVVDMESYFAATADVNEAAQGVASGNLSNSNWDGANLLGGVISEDLVSDVMANLTSVTSTHTYAADLYVSGDLVLSEEKKSETKLQLAGFLQILDDQIEAQLAAEAAAAAQAAAEAEALAAQLAAEAEAAAQAEAEAEAQVAETATTQSNDSDESTEGTVTEEADASSTETASTEATSTDTDGADDTLAVTANTTTESTDTTLETVSETVGFPFPDVNESHDYVAIADIKNRGLVGGYPDGTFRPANLINRAEFTKIVVGAATTEATGSNCFPDVLKEWFAPFVCTAKTQSIVGGYPDGTFKPGNQVNLAEAYKIIGETLFSGAVTATEVWYEGYVNLANQEGYGLDGNLAVTTQITREQMAIIISRALTAKE